MAQPQYELLRTFQQWGFDERGWFPATRRTYYYHVLAADRWLREHQGVPAVRAKSADLKVYMSSRAADGRTRNGIRAALIAFGDFLVERGFNDVNHASAIRRLPEKRDLPKALDQETARQILALAEVHQPMKRAAVYLLAFAGLRLNEARTLTWSNVDLKGGWLRFTGKGGKERVVPITKPLATALRDWRFECPSARWVLPSPQREGHPVSAPWIQRLVQQIGLALGIDHLHPHILRHTCATALFDSGTDLRTVQEWLGHSSPTTTALYTKVRPYRLKEAAERLTFGRSA